MTRRPSVQTIAQTACLMLEPGRGDATIQRPRVLGEASAPAVSIRLTILREAQQSPSGSIYSSLLGPIDRM